MHSFALHTPNDSPLGKVSAAVTQYDPGLLFPIPRQAAREALGITAPLPFWGVDIWNAYELSWLDQRGKPHVGIATLTVPATSPYLVESKSLKLYLSGFAQIKVASIEEMRETMSRDISQACGAPVTLELFLQEAWAAPHKPHSVLVQQELEGISLDKIEVDISVYEPTPSLLRIENESTMVEERLTSNLFKSMCPVTQQPDWASIDIHYHGAPIDHASLLQYLVSYRLHAGFHEQCVEQIFTDVLKVCAPTKLSVYARFTRRGGLDINPFRSNYAQAVPKLARTMRQ